MSKRQYDLAAVNLWVTHQNLVKPANLEGLNIKLELPNIAITRDGSAATCMLYVKVYSGIVSVLLFDTLVCSVF